MRNYYGSWLGISMLTVTPKFAPQYDIPSKEGALVVEVAVGGPAEEEGLKENDVVNSIDGQKVCNMEEMRLAIQSHGVRDQIEIGYCRDSRQYTIQVILTETPSWSLSKQDNLEHPAFSGSKYLYQETLPGYIDKV